MNIKKTISTGTLVASLSFSGLALGAAGCATSQAAKPATAQSDKGMAHSCGNQSCGNKQDPDKKNKPKPGETKGAESSCGEKSCGENSCA